METSIKADIKFSPYSDFKTETVKIITNSDAHGRVYIETPYGITIGFDVRDLLEFVGDCICRDD